MSKAAQQQATISMDDLTFGDLIDIEEAIGKPVTMDSLQNPSAALVVGMWWIMQRRDNPDLTFAEVKRQGIGAVELGGPKGGASGAASPSGSGG